MNCGITYERGKETLYKAVNRIKRETNTNLGELKYS